MKRSQKMILVLGLLLFTLGSITFLGGCRSYLYIRPHRRVVKTFYNKQGCRVKRIIYPCYTRRGNLKIQKVRCPDGRHWKRRWIHPDNRCSRTREYMP